MTSIHLRPPEIDERVIPDHWEGDLIKGARNASSIGTLVERTTLFLTLAKMKDEHPFLTLKRLWGFARVPLSRPGEKCQPGLCYAGDAQHRQMGTTSDGRGASGMSGMRGNPPLPAAK